ncbi:MAG TPA: hypothetical protein VF590_00985 [Isosphaeraceae bacterium]|jgi:hypothetical protein
MAYTDFTLEVAEASLEVRARPGEIFPGLQPVPVPGWLQDLLARGMQLALVSEKARSEFLVVPILLASRELSQDTLAIYSGQRLDVDPGRGLLGECDFILALTEPVPRLRAPVVTVVEAKKNDIEAGLGPCIAQMVAAPLYNERQGLVIAAVYGCVTTGEAWQFLRLAGADVILDRRRMYIDNVGGILAAFGAIVMWSGVQAG